MAAYAFGRCAVTVWAPVATDREAEHVQVAVVQLFADEIPHRCRRPLIKIWEE